MRSFDDNLKCEKISGLSDEELAALTEGIRAAHRSYLFSCDVKALREALLHIEQIEKALADLDEDKLTGMDKVRSQLIRDMRQEMPLLKTSLNQKYVGLGGRSFRTAG